MLGEYIRPSLTFKHIRKDAPAGLVVFLVALPLCLGIALASDAPLFAGIITGVVGGLIVSIFSGSEVSVSGPAAGLTVVVAASIKTMGSFDAFLLCVFLSGAMQIVFGFLRAGGLASFFPNSVIKGMLAAIGITIILKQIPQALGGDPSFDNELGFWHPFGNDSAMDAIIRSAVSLKATAVAITVGSLIILKLWETKLVKSHAWLSMVPGPLVAVILAASVNALFHLNFPEFALHSSDGHLVNLPRFSSPADLFAQLQFPKFSSITDPKVWTIAATIAAIGSIETLLSLESSDRMDTLKRISNNNRELCAQGIGNMVAGLLGGIPLTSVIVRSSANIYAGGKTRFSAFFHGVCLLVAVLAIPKFLNLIPISCLAAILLSVGYKLAKPSIFGAVMKSGPDQLIPFLVTIGAILFTDLLKGVVIGLIVGLGFIIKASYYSAINVAQQEDSFLIRFSKDVTFVHKMKLKLELSYVPDGAKLIIDGTGAKYIDHDIYELINDFVDNSKVRRISVELKNLDEKAFVFLLRRNRSNGIIQKAALSKSSLGAGKN